MKDTNREKKKSGQQENQEKRLGEIEKNVEWGGNYGRAAHASSKLWVQRCVECVMQWRNGKR